MKVGYVRVSTIEQNEERQIVELREKAGVEKFFVDKVSAKSAKRPKFDEMMNFLREGDELIGVTLTDGQSEMLVASYNGKVVRFNESGVRPMGRSATGVKAITLEEDGQVSASEPRWMTRTASRSIVSRTAAARVLRRSRLPRRPATWLVSKV